MVKCIKKNENKNMRYMDKLYRERVFYFFGDRFERVDELRERFDELLER